MWKRISSHQQYKDLDSPDEDCSSSVMKDNRYDNNEDYKGSEKRKVYGDNVSSYNNDTSIYRHEYVNGLKPQWIDSAVYRISLVDYINNNTPRTHTDSHTHIFELSDDQQNAAKMSILEVQGTRDIGSKVDSDLDITYDSSTASESVSNREGK